MSYKTQFGSLRNYEKGAVVLIDDNPKNYVFSNVFEVANRSAPYERVAVAKNFEYVIEVAKAEDTSPWFSCAHDEFVLCMDGEVEVHLIKLDNPAAHVDSASQGAHLLDCEPEGRKMGRLILRRGHQGLLPRGAAYRFHAELPGCIMLQTIVGPVTVQKWAEICQTV
ncbi:MAG: hydroxyquinol 1,2-dioxygenase [Azospirillaceae bacterium]|nr:hydroxyquinol 1,2-dioxygenase [Azospirillaceae bacterium]